MGMDIYDQYERDADQYLATHGLRVVADVLPAVREILIRETRHEADTYSGEGTVPGNTHLMRICAAQLWHGGAVEDAVLVRRARRTSMDATGAIDGQLMLGAGVARTKEYFTALGTDEAREILDEIAWLEESYDAERYAADLDDWYRCA
ncbi:hypothetical protein [Micromonospora sp. NPDC093244]|uniref:hypothetical protein n=1 Tax=Micromonospora sp. NPDC093244 TaxID=3155071 RepID=UPI003441E8C4